MADLIYKDGIWLIERDPTMAARPDLVRFVKRGPSGRKMLDQIAQWTGTCWDQSRWVPRPPMVGQGIIDLVERRMRGGAAMTPTPITLHQVRQQDGDVLWRVCLGSTCRETPDAWQARIWAEQFRRLRDGEPEGDGG